VNNKVGRADVWAHHAVYRPAMRKVLSPDARMLTIVRDPVDHWISSLTYFDEFNNYSFFDAGCDVNEYVARHGVAAVPGAPATLASNHLCLDLGIISSNADPPPLDRQLEHHVSHEWQVLVMEQFEASLELFMRTNGLSVEDVITMDEKSSGVSPYAKCSNDETNKVPNATTRLMIAAASTCDERLYTQANATLNARKASDAQLQAFTQRREAARLALQQNCTQSKAANASDLCLSISLEYADWLPVLQAKYAPQPLQWADIGTAALRAPSP